MVISLTVQRDTQLRDQAFFHPSLEDRRAAVLVLELMAQKYIDRYAIFMLRHVAAEGDYRTTLAARAALNRLERKSR